MNILEAAKKIPHGLSVITEWVGSGGVVADPMEAQSRADVCTGRMSGKRCSENDASFSVTAPVAEAVRVYLSVINKVGLRVSWHKKLGVCRKCSCNLKLLIFEPQDKVKAEMTEEEKASLPDFCWKLRL